MKPFISLLTLTALLMGMISCSRVQGQEKQEEALRIIIEKNIQGELRKIDTILKFHRDSIKSVWYQMDAQKRDSIQEEIYKKMEYFHQEHLEKMQEKMKQLHVHMEKMHDSLERRRMEVIIPRMQRLDSLRMHDFEKQLKRLDSLDHHVIIRMDSLGVHPGQIRMDIDINLEGARKGITANAIAPGYVATELLSGVSEKVMEAIVGQIPVGRLGEAEEVARCVVFLAADEAAWITGSTISINGGQLAD